MIRRDSRVSPERERPARESVRVALASLGSAFYHDDPVAKKDARDTLEQVNWVVTEAWNGIGGKVTVTEAGVTKMSAGSGKESITKAVQAVTKPDTKAGRAVRGLKTEVTEAEASPAA